MTMYHGSPNCADSLTPFLHISKSKSFPRKLRLLANVGHPRKHRLLGQDREKKGSASVYHHKIRSAENWLNPISCDSPKVFNSSHPHEDDKTETDSCPS